MKKLAIWNQDRGTWEDWGGTIDLFSAHSESYSATRPSSGMTRNGVAYELPTPALHTDDTGFSFLPTPRASRGASGTETIYMLGGELSNENRTQGQVLMPTPLASDGEKGGPNQRGAKGDLRLSSAVHLMPTPAANDSGNTPENHLRKKPGRQVVTSLMVLVDYGLIPTGGRIAPPSNDGKP